MDLGKLIGIIISSILINNFVFARFLGICPFMGVSKKIESSIGMGDGARRTVMKNRETYIDD